jgi:hypothetical protein
MRRSIGMAASLAQLKHEKPVIGSVLCASCGIPADAEYFDEATITDAPGLGRSIVLATFSLPSQYCGVLQYFSQYTDLFAQGPANVETPGIEWMIVLNGRPLYPYVNLKHVVNPWGYGSFPIAIRLEDSSTLEFMVKGVSASSLLSGSKPSRVGGRLVGRYWYNHSYSDRES